MKRRESQHESDRGAVWIRDDISAGFFAPSLDVDQFDVARVDLGDNERNVFLHT